MESTQMDPRSQRYAIATRIIVSLGVVTGFLMVAACTPSRSSGGGVGVASSVSATGAVKTPNTAIASPSEVASFVASMAEPADVDPGDFTRSKILSRSDVGLLLHSMAPSMPATEQAWRPARALAQLDQLLDSRGATATFDLMDRTQWVDRPTARDNDLMGLYGTVMVFGGAFDDAGEFAKSVTPGKEYRLTGVKVVGRRATIHYSASATDTVDVVWDLRRDPSGQLRVIGWPNFSEIVRKLGADAINQY